MSDDQEGNRILFFWGGGVKVTFPNFSRHDFSFFLVKKKSLQSFWVLFPLTFCIYFLLYFQLFLVFLPSFFPISKQNFPGGKSGGGVCVWGELCTPAPSLLRQCLSLSTTD